MSDERKYKSVLIKFFWIGTKQFWEMSVVIPNFVMIYITDFVNMPDKLSSTFRDMQEDTFLSD